MDRNIEVFQESSYQERRQRTEDALLLHIKELQKETKELSAKMNYHHAVFREEMERSVERVFQRAFPEGDPEGHRAHHELVIKRETERVEFWKTMKTKLAEWGLIGFAGWSIYYLWIAFIQGPKR